MLGKKPRLSMRVWSQSISSSPASMLVSKDCRPGDKPPPLAPAYPGEGAGDSSAEIGNKPCRNIPKTIGRNTDGRQCLGFGCMQHSCACKGTQKSTEDPELDSAK